MYALVYRGPGRKSLETWPRPVLHQPTDAIVRMCRTTVCATDLRILDGDIADCVPGTVLGHEGVGVIEEVGSGVTSFEVGDRVLISCISACGSCDFCCHGMQAHCRSGGWKLGNRIDGTQAEFVRIPWADTSLCAIPQGIDEQDVVMLDDAMPYGFGSGELHCHVKAGSCIAIIGSGAVGQAALLQAQFSAPATIIVIDADDNRLAAASRLGATSTVNSSRGDVAQHVRSLTGGRGVDAAIETIGFPVMQHLCEDIIATDGVIASLGSPETWRDGPAYGFGGGDMAGRSWVADMVALPLLLQTVQARRMDPLREITHRFKLDRIVDAYDVVAQAVDRTALKVLVEV